MARRASRVAAARRDRARATCSRRCCVDLADAAGAGAAELIAGGLLARASPTRSRAPSRATGSREREPPPTGGEWAALWLTRPALLRRRRGSRSRPARSRGRRGRSPAGCRPLRSTSIAAARSARPIVSSASPSSPGSGSRVAAIAMSSIAAACSRDAREQRRADEARVAVGAHQPARDRDRGAAPRRRRRRAAPRRRSARAIVPPEHQLRRRLVEAAPGGRRAAPCRASSRAARRAGRTRTRSARRARARTARSRRAGRSRRCRRARPGGRPGACVRMPWSQIAPWARISTAPGWRSARSASPSASGGSPRPAWISTGTLRFFGEREDVVEVAAVEDEVLRARVQLDAPRARCRGSVRLRERRLRTGPGGRTARAGRRFRAAHAEHAVVGQRCRRGGARGRAAGTRRRGALRPRRAARSSCSSVSERPSSSRPRWVCASITSASAGRRRAVSARKGASASA